MNNFILNILEWKLFLGRIRCRRPRGKLFGRHNDDDDGYVDVLTCKENISSLQGSPRLPQQGLDFYNAVGSTILNESF